MRDEWKLHSGLQSSRLKDATAAKWSLLNPSEHTTSHHENCGVGWSITHCSTRKAVNREMLAMCSVPFCEGSAAVLMQPTLDRGRATWHDAQIRHTMDPPSKQDGRGALHRHDLDGRDHDRHHHGWRAPRNEWHRTCQNTRRFPTAHLDPAAPEAGHAILCRARVPGRGGAGPTPQHHEASHGFCMPAQR